MDNNKCPLCNNEMRKPKDLYGHIVCSSCYNGIANRRQFAFIFDSLIWRLIMYVIGIPVGILLGVLGVKVGNATSLVIESLFLFVFIGKDCFSGQSPGKALMGVQVIDSETGTPSNFWKSFKRNLPLFIPLMFIFIAFSLKKGSRIGDGWAKSKVIWKKYTSNPIFAPVLNV